MSSDFGDVKDNGHGHPRYLLCDGTCQFCLLFMYFTCLPSSIEFLIFNDCGFEIFPHPLIPAQAKKLPLTCI